MYLLYHKTVAGAVEKFELCRSSNLFGYIKGIVPRLLAKKLTPDISEPYEWRVDVLEELSSLEPGSNSFVIDLKPKNKNPVLSLYELKKVWGISGFGWTPIMLYLRPLFIDSTHLDVDPKKFEIGQSENAYPVFTFLYLDGTIKEGKLIGKWTAPSPSPTNSVLLWPDTFKYFANEANKIFDEARHIV